MSSLRSFPIQSLPALTPEQVEVSRSKQGANVVAAVEVDTFWEKLLENFDDPLIKILCVALGVTLVLAVLGYTSWLEGLGIACSVLIATVVATYSEFKNEQSFQTLQSEANRIDCQVFRADSRGGHVSLQTVSLEQVVVGDLVLLQPGDRVPADGSLHAGHMQVDQKSFNGEADPVDKRSGGKSRLVDLVPQPFRRSERKLLDGDSNSNEVGIKLSSAFHVYRGSLVVSGEGILLVDAVGVNTYFGRMAGDMVECHNDGVADAPLQVKLKELADLIAQIGYVGATCIAVSFLFKQVFMDHDFDYAKISAYFLDDFGVFVHDLVTSIILAIIVVVVAVPEGLPMMIAVVLSLNMRKLLKHHVLVRKLIGIETAGSLSMLLCDKTGTITEGRLQPLGFLLPNAVFASTLDHQSCNELMRGCVAVSVMSSNAGFVQTAPASSFAGGTSRSAEDVELGGGANTYNTDPDTLRHGTSSTILQFKGGNITDRALLKAAFMSRATGYACADSQPQRTPYDGFALHQQLQQEFASEVVNALPFSSLHKLSAAQVRFSARQTQSRGLQTVIDALSGGAATVTFLQGAPEILVPKCTRALSGNGHEPFTGHRDFMEAVTQQCSQGRRLVALAVTQNPSTQWFRSATPGSPVTPPDSLILVGCVCICDPPRPAAKAAVDMARSAGIHVIMCTGDKVETAVSVARQVGLLPENEDGSERKSSSSVFTSDQLRHMPVAELRTRLPNIRVIARALPTDKSLLVNAARQSSGNSAGLSADGSLTSFFAASHDPESRVPLLAPAEAASPRASTLRKQGWAWRVMCRRLLCPPPESREDCEGFEEEVVGMTGDGVNDCVALKQADVSFAMGSGAEMSKAAADIVILSNDLLSIVQAVWFGRTIFKAIRKFIVFQSTVNLASMCIVFLGPFLGFDFPLTLIQLLWVNLVMDTLAALAFGGSPALPSYIRAQPVSRSAPLITSKMAASITVNGLAIAFMSVVFLTWDPVLQFFSRAVLSSDGTSDAVVVEPDGDVDDWTDDVHNAHLRQEGGPVFLTAFFSFFIFVCTFNAFNVRTDGLNLFRYSSQNPQFWAIMAVIFVVQIAFTELGGSVLRTVPLTAGEWAVVVLFAFLIIPLDLLRKLAIRAYGGVVSGASSKSD